MPRDSGEGYRRDILAAREEGHREGLRKGRLEIIDFLENAYIHADDRPDRNSERGAAILQLAEEAVDHFRPLVDRERERGSRSR